MALMNKVKVITISGFLAAGLFAQEGSALQKAFETSYLEENKGNYYGSATALSNLYAADNYALNLRLGWLHYLLKDYTGSVDFYQKACGLLPLSIEAKLGLVKPLSAMEKWNEVLLQYQNILKIDEMNSTANYWIASVYYLRKEYASSAKYLEKVVNSYPFDYSSTVLLGWTYLQLEQGTDAKTLFNKALLMKPHDASALEGLRKTGL
jgi:tetratricopeptide (TPR) repeat protein